MTLSIIAQNSAFAVQITDRRITAGGTVVSEEQEKAFTIETEDARVCVSYTGLAKTMLFVGEFDTYQWLIQTFIEAGPPDYQIYNVIERFAAIATKRFSTDPWLLRLATHVRTLEIIIAGYFYGGDEPFGIQAHITNIQADGSVGEFQATQWHENIRSDEPFYWVRAIGFTTPLPPEGWRPVVASLLNPKASPNALISQISDVIDRVSQSPLSRNFVGRQLDTIEVHRDPEQHPLSARVSAVATHRFSTPGMVMIKEEGSFAIGSFFMEADPSKPPITVPRAHRNAPCPCGSRRSYRGCHGKKPKPGKGISIEFKREPGNHIVVDIKEKL